MSAVDVVADALAGAAVFAGVRNRSRAFLMDVLLERSSTRLVEDRSPAGKSGSLEPMLSEGLRKKCGTERPDGDGDRENTCCERIWAGI